MARINFFGMVKYGMLGLVGGLSILAFKPSNNITRYLSNQPFLFEVRDGNVDEFVERYASFIKEASSLYNVPPELIVATLKSENVSRQGYEDLKDRFGTLFGIDTSLGAGQIKISTAQGLDLQIRGKALSREETIDNLLDPVSNINYIARFYASELRRLGMHGKDILGNPEIIAELGSRYVGGCAHGSESARLAGFNILAYLMDSTTFKPFERSKAEIDNIKFLVRRYLCSLPSAGNSRECSI